MDPQKRITDKAHELFFQFGVRRISMDEIANGLGISKKTVYRFFSNKEVLITTIVEKEIRENPLDEKVLNDKMGDAINLMFFILRHAINMHLRFNGVIINDLKKYYPAVYEILMTYKNENIYHALNRCLTEGTRQGFFNQGCNIDLMTRFILASVPIISAVSQLSESKPGSKDLADEMLIYLVRGLSTQKASNSLIFIKYSERFYRVQNNR
ncbi:MAG: hypothetical protein C0191_04610 [Mucilaginibacter sp.]|nr:MAG: hypothetical protein C0191_04610 [Mucilaginibacter sp.]HEK22050.1 TetR/AcrR family transcriptional regulator [Bacteroidota bacterium]